MYDTAQVHRDNVALFTDYYQLTMLQAYYREDMDQGAVFDLFVRKLEHRNYLLACGLEDALEYLETLHFSEASLDYLSSLRVFHPDFIDWISEFRFTGDVYAVKEGTPVFANEPILEVVAPISQAQLVETYLLNQITFQTGIASKASRVVRAAVGRDVVDFGMRRMHGTDAALKAARAAFVAGVVATSNVLAASAYGIRPTGTMAHSYIEAHDREEESFYAFASLFPGTTLLVDTFDTLDGVRKVVELSRRAGDSFQVGAIRLDSGDLAALAHASREILDAAGLQNIKVFASGNLDEYAIRDLLAEGAPIDGFGVGTRMGTMADKPYLDSAYKLAEYAGKGRMKLSPSKSNLPGRKQVYRIYESGKAVRDVIATNEERHEGTPLLECVMRGGKRTLPSVSLQDIRTHATESLSFLPDRLFELEEADPPYTVEISKTLQEKREETRRAVNEKTVR